MDWSRANGEEIIAWCRELAKCTDVPGETTRTYLSPATREAHRIVIGAMEQAGMQVRVDAAGNVRGLCQGTERLLIGSHIDTVPNAGAFDGVLGVAIGIALAARRPRRGIEVVAFSEEEGVRFGVPFIGSRALTGTLDRELLARQDAEGVSVEQAIRNFGLDPDRLNEAVMDSGVTDYLEFHIEQGPVLESLGQSIGVVEAIAGQTRMEFRFEGKANHAGTTPMHLRHDALAGAAEWILRVEYEAQAGLVATVGRIEVKPGVGNVVPGEAACSLDVRHADDAVRIAARDRVVAAAEEICARRGLNVRHESRLEQNAVPMRRIIAAPEAPRIVSGAGHDAMIIASKVPAAMIFIRSPGGISHHPDETVLPGDVEAALEAGNASIV